MTGRYIRTTKHTYAPSRVLSVVCETEIVGFSSDGTYADLSLVSVHTAYSTRRGSTWSSTDCRKFYTGEEFHDYLESLCLKKKCLYVVSPIASQTLRWTGFWDRITNAGAIQARSRLCNKNANSTPLPQGTYVFSALVLNGKPDIIRYHKGSGSVCWVSGRQFFDTDESELDRCVQCTLSHIKTDSSSYHVSIEDASYSASVWLNTWKACCLWWLSVSGGPWGLTSGQMAMSFFRKRLEPKAIVSHNNESARQLEHYGIFGGRSSGWYFGNVISAIERIAEKDDVIFKHTYGRIYEPIQSIDVRSMYPYILAEYEFPTKHISTRGDYSIKHIRDKLSNYCVIASVIVSTQKSEYPCRLSGRIHYPCGDFVTVLCGRELESAINEGYVREILIASIYHKGRPFRQMANDLLLLRAQYRLMGMEAWEMFIKLLSNSFGGKLAQRAKSWIERPNVAALYHWGQWTVYDTDTKTNRIYRATAGMVDELMFDCNNKRPMGSCFAYLTMYGRYMMRQIRERFPIQSVLCQDTDGLWVKESSIKYIEDIISKTGEEPGKPRLQKRAYNGRFWSPKHFWLDGNWTLSGYHEPRYDYDIGKICHSSYHNNIKGCPVIPPSLVKVEYKQSYLRPMEVDGIIYDNGWTLPLVLR